MDLKSILKRFKYLLEVNKIMEEVVNIIVAIFIGALIGLQREYTQQHKKTKTFAGIRTFIFVAFLGSILGYLSESFNSILVILGFVFIILFSIMAYFFVYKKSKNVSGTTEISFVLTYILGVMTTTGHLEISIIFGIVIATFLTFKDKLHKLAKKMEGEELVAMVEFALIAFVILPFLPNQNYSPADIPGLNEIFVSLGGSENFLSQIDVFNFYNIWLMVIFIAGINLVGYFLVKLFGSKKGHGLAGFIGGLVSSTAVTVSMAEESKKTRIVKPLLIATILATAVMFIRVIFEVAILNFKLLPELILPVGGMAIVSFLLAFILYRQEKVGEKEVEDVELKQPFALLPALKFGGLFILVLFISKTARIIFGKTGIYVTSFFSGLADVDAITLTMSSLSNSGGIISQTAVTAILLAVISNTLVKVGIVKFLGSKKLSYAVLFSFLFILLIGTGLLLMRYFL